MIKQLIFLSSLLFSFCVAAAPLRFNENGKLKIVQFTDNHYKHGKKASNAAVECIETILDAEQPDAVVFTGDMVYSDHVAESIDAILQPVIDRGVPFAFVFGNHDTEFDLTYPEIYDYISSKPGALLPPRGKAESPDYIVEIASSASDSILGGVLYCLDSHRTAQLSNCGKYAWIEQPQIQWYRSVSDSLMMTNRGEPLHALMFFHIPLPEIDYAYSESKVRRTGTKKEAVCSPKINSGMFYAVKNQGDVKGIFFGHDHDNDYIVDYFDVLLGYGRYSGGNTVYNHLGKNGARVILFDEATGDIDTWLRISDGEIIHPFSSGKKN